MSSTPPTRPKNSPIKSLDTPSPVLYSPYMNLFSTRTRRIIAIAHKANIVAAVAAIVWLGSTIVGAA